MIPVIKYSLRFIFLALAQSLIFNQIEIGYGIQFFIYPIFLFLLPWEMKTIPLMFYALLFGSIIDFFSNTYGLHASASVFTAFIRPIVFKKFEPRDGYELEQELSIFHMEFPWIISVHGILLSLHLFWFFIIEIFRFNDILFILQKTILSFIASFTIIYIIQLVFIRKK